MITIASDKYQHNGYDIELKTTPNGIEAICTEPKVNSLLLPPRPTRAEALYVAMRTIDARSIVNEIDNLIAEAQTPDDTADKIGELASRLEMMIRNG